MLIYTIIFFGLAVIRTITPFAKKETYSKTVSFIGSLSVAVTLIIAYIWFLQQFISLKQ